MAFVVSTLFWREVCLLCFSRISGHSCESGVVCAAACMLCPFRREQSACSFVLVQDKNTVEDGNYFFGVIFCGWKLLSWWMR